MHQHPRPPRCCFFLPFWNNETFVARQFTNNSTYDTRQNLYGHNIVFKMKQGTEIWHTQSEHVIWSTNLQMTRWKYIKKIVKKILGLKGYRVKKVTTIKAQMTGSSRVKLILFHNHQFKNFSKLEVSAPHKFKVHGI